MSTAKIPLSEMERLIPVVNKLQEVFNTVGFDGLDLPQIIVVGSQSSGKSSVLESIVGRDFLPRGSGIVTRRPLLLQLIHLNNPNQQEFGEFNHRPNEKFTDFDKIREEIERETDRLTGRNKGVSPVPIVLKISSPHVLNLTLVDLPGMTRVPVGDQPHNIEQQIRDMIMSFASRPKSVILAVSAANTDLANSDALKLAREVDPEGQRTIGVLTKLDIMDKGTDAFDILVGKVYPLKLGFIGVVNRSQQDIITKKPIGEALKYEQQYFQSHTLYQTMNQRLGVPYLAKTLNRILIQHIRDCLPELKQRINKMLSEASTQLQNYGTSLLDTKSGKGALLLQIIRKFCDTYRNAIDGRLSESAPNELFGGARINFIFNDVFGKLLDRVDPLQDMTDIEIRTAIKNATGPKAALFVPEVAFELLVKGQIARLEDPSLECVELVHDELQRIIQQLPLQELSRFPRMREQILECAFQLLTTYRQPTREMITHLIEIELAFINTNHPDFEGGDRALEKILEHVTQDDQATNINNNNPANANAANTQNPSPFATYTNQFPNLSMQDFNPAAKSVPQTPHSTQLGFDVPPQTAPRTTSQPQKDQPSTQQSQQKQQQSQQQQQQQQEQAGGFWSTYFYGKPQQPQASTSPNNASSAPPVPPKQQTQQQTQPQQQQSQQQSQPKMPPNLPPKTSVTQAMQSSQQSAQSSQSNQPVTRERSNTRTDDRLEQVTAVLKASGNPTRTEVFETTLIKHLLHSYFGVVRKNVKDSVPKSIMHFLVNRSKESMQNELVARLYKDDLVEDLIEESPLIAQKRLECQRTIEALSKAHQILAEVREFNA